MPNRSAEKSADKVADAAPAAATGSVEEVVVDKEADERSSVIRGLERSGGIAKLDELADRTDPKVNQSVVTKSLKTLEEQGLVWTMQDGRVALASAFPRNVAVTG